MVWVVAVIGVAVVGLVCLLLINAARHIDGSAAVLNPESTQGATFSWLQDEAAPVMQTVSEEMTAVSEAGATNNAAKMAKHLQAAGEALTGVSQSPDDGSLSSAMHLAGRRYVEASTAVAGGDWALANKRITEGNSVLANVNTRINHL